MRSFYFLLAGTILDVTNVHMDDALLFEHTICFDSNEGTNYATVVRSSFRKETTTSKDLKETVNKTKVEKYGFCLSLLMLSQIRRPLWTFLDRHT